MQFILAPATGSENDVAKHVLDCAACRVEVGEWSRILSSMDEALLCSQPDEGCLDENDLSEFLDGVGGRHERERIEDHLAQCRKCVRRLIALYELVSAAEPQQTFHGFELYSGERGLELNKESMRNVIVLELTPELVLRGTRNHGNVVALSAPNAHCELRLVIQRHDDEKLSLVLHFDAPELPGQVTVSLSNKNVLLESRTISLPGLVRFLELAPGEYSVQLAPEPSMTIQFSWKGSIAR